MSKRDDESVASSDDGAGDGDDGDFEDLEDDEVEEAGHTRPSVS